MASYTTLVHVDGDTPNKLALFISQLVGGAEGAEYVTACKLLIDAQKTEDLISKFLEKKDLILGVNERDVEGCFEAIVSVMFTLREEVDSVSVVRQILAALSDKNERAKLRLRCMVSLFNLTVSGQSKYDVLSGEVRLQRVLCGFLYLLFCCMVQRVWYTTGYDVLSGETV